MEAESLRIRGGGASTMLVCAFRNETLLSPPSRYQTISASSVLHRHSSSPSSSSSSSMCAFFVSLCISSFKAPSSPLFPAIICGGEICLVREKMIRLFKVREKQRELAEKNNGKTSVKKQSAGELRIHKGTIMTISKDRVVPFPTPDSLKMNENFATGGVLAAYQAVIIVVFFWFIN